MAYGDSAAKPVQSPNGNDDGFVVKFAAGSGQTLWANALGSTKSGVVHSVVTTSTNDVVAAFAYGQTFTIGGTKQLTASGSYDIGLVQFNANGGFVNAAGYGGTSFAIASTMTIDRWDEIILGGWETGTVDFGKQVPTYGLRRR